MKNKYKVVGDIVVIFLQNGLKTKVSKCHLDRLLVFPGKWTADKDYRKSGNFYVKSQTMENGKTTTTILARFLTKAPPGKVVDHINGDTLDNTDENLRAVDCAKNSQNQKIVSSNNVSGIRGIRLNRHGKYRPTPMINGKRYSLPSRKTIEEATADLIALYDRLGVPYRKDV